jgi:hypothetical protein
MVAERSKAWTVFARSDASRSWYPSGLRHELSSLARTPGPWVRIQLWTWMFSVCVYIYVCVFLCLCTGRGLETSWSPVQGVLPTVLDLVTEVKRKVLRRRRRPELGCRHKGKKFPKDLNSQLIVRLGYSSLRPFINTIYSVTLSRVQVQFL